MWHVEHSETANASSETIWALYEDVERWKLWDPGLVAITLDGSFVAGSSGTMTFEGQPPLSFHLTEVRVNEGFTDETPIEDAGVIVRFIHTLTRLAPNATRITHRLEIDGPAAADVAPELGPQIAADIPDSLASLARFAEGR